MASQNSPTAQLEAATANVKQKKPRQSRMPLGVKAAVAAMAVQNATISDISRTCDIDRGTVRAILSSTEIQQHVDEVRSDFVLAGDLWKARKVMRQKLNKGSESAATTILRGFNVLQSNPKVEVNVLNVGAAAYAQRMQAKADESQANNQPAITVSTTTNSASDPSQS